MKIYFRVLLSFCISIILFVCASRIIPETSNFIREIHTSVYAIDLSKQFLFIAVLGNDLCPNTCGECVVSEAVAPSFEFKDGKLILYDFSNLYDKSFQGVKTWNEYKSKNNL